MSVELVDTTFELVPFLSDLFVFSVYFFDWAFEGEESHSEFFVPIALLFDFCSLIAFVILRQQHLTLHIQILQLLERSCQAFPYFFQFFLLELRRHFLWFLFQLIDKYVYFLKWSLQFPLMFFENINHVWFFNWKLKNIYKKYQIIVYLS